MDDAEKLLFTGMYELFYSNGGHGGPYALKEADDAAKRLLAGNRNMEYIEIRPYIVSGPGGFGKAIKTVHRATVERQPELPELHKAMYLDYVNNFASVSAFATHYYISEAMARLIIDEQRELAKVS